MGLFTKDIKTLDDLFLHGLQDIYYAENQIVKALPKMIENASKAELKKGGTAVPFTPTSPNTKNLGGTTRTRLQHFAGEPSDVVDSTLRCATTWLLELLRSA